MCITNAMLELRCGDFWKIYQLQVKPISRDGSLHSRVHQQTIPKPKWLFTSGGLGSASFNISLKSRLKEKKKKKNDSLVKIKASSEKVKILNYKTLSSYPLKHPCGTLQCLCV